MLTLKPEMAAPELDRWFTALRETLDATVFAVGSSEPHRRAAALNVVTRHVAQLEDAVSAGQRESEVRETAWILAGATRVLNAKLGEAQWRSAARNVNALDAQMEGLQSAWVADIVSIFREHFLEALRQAGVTRHATILGPEDRKAALGLSVNWGLRYLIAAAAGLVDRDLTDRAVREIVAAVAS